MLTLVPVIRPLWASTAVAPIPPAAVTLLIVPLFSPITPPVPKSTLAPAVNVPVLVTLSVKGNAGTLAPALIVPPGGPSVSSATQSVQVIVVLGTTVTDVPAGAVTGGTGPGPTVWAAEGCASMVANGRTITAAQTIQAARH